MTARVIAGGTHLKTSVPTYVGVMRREARNNYGGHMAFRGKTGHRMTAGVIVGGVNGSQSKYWMGRSMMCDTSSWIPESCLSFCERSPEIAKQGGLE